MTRIYCAAIAVLALASCGGGPPAGYQLDASIAAAIPADTRFLAGGRWDLLQKSPLFAKLEPMLPGEGLAAFKERYGIDPRTDVKEFAVAHNGTDAVVLLRGSFSKLKADGNAGIVRLSDTLLAAGPAARLRECVDRMAKPAPLPARFAKALAATPASAHFWFTGAGGGTLNLPLGSNLANVDKVLASLESVSGWGDTSKGLRVSATGLCADAANAKQLHTQLRGLIGMGRLSTPDNQPELLKLFDGLQTKLDDKTIQVDIDLAAALVEKALGQLQGIRR